MELFDATLDVAKVLGLVYLGAEKTGGSATAIADDNLRDRAGTYTDGTLWITSGTRIGSTRLVNNHSAKALTFDALAGNLTAGDKYAVAKPTLTRDQLRNAVNQALQEIEPYTKDYEDAALVTVAGQEDYELPAGVSDLVDVYVAKSTEAPYRYELHTLWMELQTGTLRFLMNEPSISGYRIRLGYNARHSELLADSDDVDAGIDRVRLKWEAAIWAWRTYLQGKNDANVAGLGQTWFAEANAQAQRAPRHRVAKRAKTLIIARFG